MQPALKYTQKAFQSYGPKDGRKRLTVHQVIVSRSGYMALRLLQTG